MNCVHIGTYKTGSKSLQSFLGQHRKHLSALGRPVLQGRIQSNNHIELYLSAMRRERDSLGKIALGLVVDDAFVQQTRSEVAGSGARIFSTEGLSLLRYDDEMERLKSLVGPAVIIVVRRNRADFLKSYRAQILSVKGRRPSEDPESALYVGEDAWIADHDALVSIYGRHFGDIRVVDYDAAVTAEGEVLPAVLQAMEIDIPVTAGQYRLNARGSGMRGLLRRAVTRGRALIQGRTPDDA
jgi:hypothetical protein